MEKVKVGILGLKRGFSHLTGCLAAKNIEVIGCADRLKDLRDKAEGIVDAKKVKVLAEFDDLLELKPDAVVIVSNGRLQASHSIKAMKAGCHVLSEIPGAFTQEEITQIILTAGYTGKQYMMAENTCFWDFFRYWRKWLLEGQFGAVSLAEGEYLHYLPYSMIDDSGNRYTPQEVREKNIKNVHPLWRADQPPIQYSTHDIGPLLEVLDDRIVSVSCYNSAFRCNQAPLRADGQIALFKTAKGSLIKIMVTLNTRRPGSHNYRLFGTLGSAEWYTHENFCRIFKKDKDEASGWDCADIGFAASGEDTSGHGGADAKMPYYFAKALLEGKQMPIDVYRMSDFTLPGILAARSADIGGQPVDIPDMRPIPFEGTKFWDHIGLPENEPHFWKYKPPSNKQD
jgi:predicted dehydrogenase